MKGGMEKREGGRRRGRGYGKKGGREGERERGRMRGRGYGKKEGGRRGRGMEKREGVRRIREEGRGMEITGKEGGRV